jgi:hypothetical protein
VNAILAASAYEEFHDEDPEPSIEKPRRLKKNRDPEWTRSMDAVSIADVHATIDLS